MLGKFALFTFGLFVLGKAVEENTHEDQMDEFVPLNTPSSTYEIINTNIEGQGNARFSSLNLMRGVAIVMPESDQENENGYTSPYYRLNKKNGNIADSKLNESNGSNAASLPINDESNTKSLPNNDESNTKSLPINDGSNAVSLPINDGSNTASVTTDNAVPEETNTISEPVNEELDGNQAGELLENSQDQDELGVQGFSAIGCPQTIAQMREICRDRCLDCFAPGTLKRSQCITYANPPHMCNSTKECINQGPMAYDTYCSQHCGKCSAERGCAMRMSKPTPIECRGICISAAVQLCGTRCVNYPGCVPDAVACQNDISNFC